MFLSMCIYIYVFICVSPYIIFMCIHIYIYIKSHMLLAMYVQRFYLGCLPPSLWINRFF